MDNCEGWGWLWGWGIQRGLRGGCLWGSQGILGPGGCRGLIGDERAWEEEGGCRVSWAALGLRVIQGAVGHFPHISPLFVSHSRTKRRRLRVLSTRQRPVPLEHFLYTGGGGAPSPRDLFLLLDARGAFSTQG